MIYYLLLTIDYWKTVARRSCLVARGERRVTSHESQYTIKYSIVNSQSKRGFTLAELLVALMVTAIVLAAVGSLAYAMSSANDSSDDTSLTQAQVRSATMRITDLIRNAKLVCGTPTNAIVIWRADADSNKKINSDELVYIQSDAARDKIQLIQYNRPASYNTTFTLAEIQSGAAKSALDSACVKTTVELIPQCSGVVFAVDNAAIPQKSKLASVKFTITENDSTHTYEICAAVMGPSFNLLNSSNVIVGGDDD